MKKVEYNKQLLLHATITIVYFFTVVQGNSELRTTTNAFNVNVDEEVTDATASVLMDTSFFGCTFDDGYCDWSNDTDAEFVWTKRKGETPSKDTGPRWDHTIGRQKGQRGYYIYIEASSPRKNGDRARIISPEVGKPGTYCLKFWHHMHGSEIRDLNVYIRSVKSQKVSQIGHWSGPWSIETDTVPWVFDNNDWWNVEYINFVTDENVQIIFEGVRGENYHGDIALDDISLSVGNCPKRSIDCNFNINMCGWTQMTGDEFNWLPNKGPTNTADTGPLYDHHVSHDDEGLYLYMEASWPRKDGDKARLLSPPVSCVPGSKPVFLFWYNMHGVDMGPLRVYISSDASHIDFPLWEVNSAQGQDWLLGQIPVPESLVIIEAERNEYRGDSAIDDVSLIGCHNPSDEYPTLKTTPKTGVTITTTKPVTKATSTAAPVVNISLPNNINCTFEGQTLCGWGQDRGDDFDWTLFRGPTDSFDTGPKSDRANSTGYYMYIEASSPQHSNDKAMLRSPLLPANSVGCFSFYYHMYGKSMGSLEVFLSESSGGRMTQLWIKEGEQSKNDTDWKRAYVNINSTDTAEIVIRGTRGINLFSDIAIDDLNFSLQKCPDKLVDKQKLNDLNSPTDIPITSAPKSGVQITESLIRCTFERKQLCRWNQVNTPFDDFNWIVGSSTMSKGTGPTVDHSTGSKDGSFAYIEASAPRAYGHRAALKSERLTLSSPACFRFWFHMFGTDTGSLTILKQVGKYDEPTPIWSRNGNHNDVWFEGMVDLEPSTGFNILVEATRGSGWRSDIAVDDFSLELGACPQVNCSFNDSFCGWKQRGMRDDFSWERHNGPTDSLNTGPQEARDGSFYAYIEASKPRQRKDIARLVSPTIILPEPSACLSFWYHVYGEHIGKLSVYKKEPQNSKDYLGSPLWYIDTDEGDQWLFARINVYDRKPFQLVIEGEVGVDYGGDIAIDDIVLIPGKCNGCCGDETFLCGNNLCIPAHKRCDGVNDCGDESDESFCGACGISHTPPFITAQNLQMPSMLIDENTNLTKVRDQYSEEGPREQQENIRTTFSEEKLTNEGQVVARLSDEEVRNIVHPKLKSNKEGDGDPENEISEWAKKSEVMKISAEDRKRRSIMDDFYSILKDPNTKKELPKPEAEEDGAHEVIAMQKLMKLPKEERTAIVVSFMDQQKLIQEKSGPNHDIGHEEYTAMVPSKRRRSEKFKQDPRLLSRTKRKAILKITGGVKAKWHSHPWQVAYYVTASDVGIHYFCGGTLIDRYWVLTAAHCPQLGDLHEIVLGDYDLYKDEGVEQEMIVDAVYVHQKYNFSLDLVADIALIKLRYPARSTRAVQKACLLDMADVDFPPDHVCFSTGWGRIQANVRGVQQILREARMPIVDDHTCQNKFWSIYEIYESMVCAGGIGSNSCKGDSGGPLVCPKLSQNKKFYQFYAVGITSWGDTKCQPYVPGVYTRIRPYMRWITKIMHQDKCHRYNN